MVLGKAAAFMLDLIAESKWSGERYQRPRKFCRVRVGFEAIGV